MPVWCGLCYFVVVSLLFVGYDLQSRNNKEDFMQNISVKTHAVQATTTNTTLPLQQIYQLVAKYSIDQQFIIAEYKKNKH
jgi:hypothetical protein